jgi:hypothetical protein
MAILQSRPVAERVAHKAPTSPWSGEDLEFLQPNPKFEEPIRYSKDPSSRFWLFYHACHLEAFGRTAPFGRLPEPVVDRIALVLDESVPESFKNPGDRRTFSKHADKASYLYERQQALVDMAVETFDGVAQGMYRRSESERDEQVRRHAPALNEKVRMSGATETSRTC